ncbi:hypothetical protein jhhlp_000098 [Lomentospora prolificans]|uniref:ADF-H domain-containing protein n=1 Tax=Lomentospora prolificans TaxID=41688 RepID=A0A2N3NLM1_9PEZI|nr:hypothetical protein jhhlp_000098 [Lomentospora prolificans]
MSLNGLDDPKVKEAHDAAFSEPGGWFLLKYASRDEIDILARGNGGIVEIRNAISEYEETSPLYGFLRYRRRSVIIKYLPEGCSRLIQARVTVHFNSVCERFSPHDTTFSITTASELKDTKLSAACSLHAASGSTSSSTSSLRRRRLVEIAEEDEEEQQRASKRQSLGEVDAPDAPAAPANEEATGDENPASETEPPVVLDAELAASPEKGNFTNTTDPPNFIGVPRPPSPAKSFDTAARRMSSQSTRPDYYSYSSYGRQKVKLGPRPSLDQSGRPQTATGTTFRPVSTIPAGFKLFSKGSKKGKSKDSAGNDPSSSPEQQHAVPEITFGNSIVPMPEPPDSPVVEEPRRPHTSSGPGPGRPSTSSGASFVMPPFKQTTPVKEKMTPEKARLMKAMQLREKKKKMSMMPPVPALPPAEQYDKETEETSPESTIPEETTDKKLEVEDTDQDDKLSLSQADSAIVMEAGIPAATDQASEAAQTDSLPASPYIASSEAAQSTKASSLSESTDETVQISHDKEETEEDDRPDVDDSFPPVDTQEEPTQAEVEDATEEVPLPVPEPTVAEEPETAPLDAQEDDDDEAEAEVEASPIARISAALPVSKFSTVNGVTTDENGAVPNRNPEAEVEEDVTDVRQERRRSSLRIPKSKFSTRDLRADAGTATEITPPLPVIPTIENAAEAEVVANTEPEPNDEIQLQGSKDQDRTSMHSRLSRKTATLEPIRTDLAASSRGSHNLSDDEELLDELQSATVEEAKPIMVAKSPMTPVFPALIGKDGSVPSGVRTVSQPNAPKWPSLLSPRDVPPPSGTRSISSGAAFLHKITQQQAPSGGLAPKKANIGSSISQRIKALEKLSAGSGEANATEPAQPRPKTPSANFFSVRKSSVREPSRSPSVAERATSFSKSSPPPPGTRESSPETSRQRSRERSASLANRLTMFESGPPPPLPPSRGRTESIQVKARIVRDPSIPVGSMPDHKDPTEYSQLELKQSPLIVDHQKAEPELPMRAANPAPAPVPKETIQERRMSREKRRSESNDRGSEVEPKARRSSLSIVKDFIKERRKSLTSPSVDNLMAPTPSTPSRSPSRPPSVHQNPAFPRRLSISSRRSSVSKDPGTGGTLSPSAHTETSGSGDESKSGTSEKKSSKSRAGRFMRRLSSSLHGSRGKNTPTGISPTLHEEVSTEAINTRTPEQHEHTGPTIVAYMGDVNVQFPDNLLWKRRSLCLDSQGFLILSTAAATAAPMDKQPSGAGVKRYHLSEFRMPYPPEMEVQELPNSVVLDFVDGSGLQVACEDRAGQMHVLQILVEAHKNHSSFGQ